MEPVSNINEKTYTLAEVQQHRDAQSIWLAIADNVYDVTKFMEEVYMPTKMTGRSSPVIRPTRVSVIARNTMKTNQPWYQCSLGAPP